MSKLSHLRIIPPGVDPSIALAPADDADQHSRAQGMGTRMGGSKLLLSGVVLLIVIVTASTGLNQSPHEATAIMERLATQVETANRIAPETRETILKLLSTRRYDCEEVKCDERLQVRNRLARERISKAILAGSLAADETKQGVTGSR